MLLAILNQTKLLNKIMKNDAKHSQFFNLPIIKEPLFDSGNGILLFVTQHGDLQQMTEDRAKCERDLLDFVNRGYSDVICPNLFDSLTE